MIGVSFVEESNQLLKNVEGVELSQILNTSIEDNFMYDQFDFDTSNFLDLIEYTDFQDFDDYLFVSFTEEKRLNKIVNLLNQFSEVTKFHYISIDKDSNTSITEHVNKSELRKLRKKDDELSEEALRNGVLSLFTGIYPGIFKKNIIKHIYIENKEFLEKIDSSIYLNSTINHGIYIDQNETESISLPGVVVWKDTLNTFNFKRDLQMMTNEELDKVIQNFIKTGDIVKKNHKLGIIDYDTMCSMDSARRLFIRKTGVYIDYQSVYQLANKVDATFSEIEISKSGLMKTKKSNGLVQILPLLVSVALNLDGNKIKFITPYNKRKLDEEITKEYKNNWLVFSEKNNYYAYNLINNRVFQVNELFADIFEADIKDSLEKATNFNPDITYELISEQKELMQNV